MNSIEKVRKIREKRIIKDEFGKPYDCYNFSESEAAALLTDEPSKTAEEGIDRAFMRYASISHMDMMNNEQKKLYEAFKLGAEVEKSALSAHAKAKVEEAADRFCFNGCSRPIGPGDGECQISDKCPSRAAILGQEVGK